MALQDQISQSRFRSVLTLSLCIDNAATLPSTTLDCHLGKPSRKEPRFCYNIVVNANLSIIRLTHLPQKMMQRMRI